MPLPQADSATAAPPTRERIVAAARDLFLERGFFAASLQQIARRAAANPGSLYYFFKSKEELLAAVLDWYLANLQTEIVAPAFAASADPLQRLFRILDGYRQMLIGSDFAVGCPIGNLAIEVGPFIDSARQLIVANFDAWQRSIRECLDELPLPADVDSAALSSHVLTTMEGAVLLSRAYRSIEPYETSIHSLGDYLQHLMNRSGRREAH